MFEVEEEAPRANIFPLGIRTGGARTPEAIAATGEETQTVDAAGVEDLLLGVAEQVAKEVERPVAWVAWADA